MFNSIITTLSDWRYKAGEMLLRGSPTRNGYGRHDSAALDPQVWDTLGARMRRYAVNEGFYTNRIFNNRVLFDSILEHRPKKPYKFTRGVLNPVSRLVELQTSKVYGGELDMQNAASGAIPVIDASDELRRAIVRLWVWSNWAQEKTQYTKLGAIFGDSFLKIVDDPARGKVRIEVVDPRKVKDIKVNEYGDVKRYMLQYERMDDDTGETYTYTEIGSDEDFETYRDSTPLALYRDASGTPVARWDNEYGFCPFVLTPHEKTASTFGDTSFSVLLDKIIEICSQSSLLNDAVSKGVNPLLAFSGVSRQDVELDTNRPDAIPMLFLGAAGSVNPVGALTDIGAVSAHIDALQAEIERDLPELSLHRLRDGGNVTAPGIRAAYNDASARLQRLQGNYDAGMIKAHQMAVAIGGMRGYVGFEGFGLDSYEAGDLDHSIAVRPIVSDEIDKAMRLQMLQSVDTELFLRELGYDDDVIARVLGRKDEAQRNAIRGLTEGVFGASDDTDDDANEEGEVTADDDTAETETVSA